MLLGTQTSFAIEVHVAEVLFAQDGEPWPEGTVRYWCDGRPFGDGRRRSLRAYMLGLPFVIGQRSQRFDDLLCETDPRTAFTTIVDAIYRDDDRTDEQLLEDSRVYRRFVVTPSVLDGFYVVVIEGSAGCRVMCGDIDRTTFASATLPSGEFEALLGGALVTIKQAVETARQSL